MIDLNSDFADAAGYRLPARTPLKHVGPNAFGILTPASREKILVTKFTFVCTGVALVAADGSGTAALVHVLSGLGYYAKGEERVAAHARKSWEFFERKLNPQTEFRAVVYGGKNHFMDRVVEKPEDDGLKDLFRMQGRDLKTQRSRAYKKADADTKKEMRAPYHEHMSDPVRLDLNNRVNKYVSGVISETIYDCLIRADYISDLRDLRYRDVPHDAAVERVSGRIVVGREQDNIFEGRKIRDFGGCRLPTLRVV